MENNEGKQTNVQFEPDYELVKTNPNAIWEKYEAKILKLTNGMAYWKSFDKNELLQQAYIFFVTLCKNYDPYYLGNFYPFDRYLFKNLITKLRAYIQRYYVKSSREKPSECTELQLQKNSIDPIKDKNDKMYSEYIYSLLTPRQTEILKLTIAGYRQQEIGQKLNISQSRVSVIKKKTIEILNELLDETMTKDKKNKMKIKKMQETFYS